MPTQWQATAQQARETLRNAPWWHAFGDEQLNALIERVLSSNQTLESSAMAMKAAALSQEVAQANRLPTLGLNARSTANRLLRGRAAASNTLASTPVADPTPRTTMSKSFSGSIGYTLDLWGTLASHAEAARWQARATEQDWEGLVLQQIAATITLYGNLAYLGHQLAQSAQSIAYAQRTLELARARNRFGAVPTTDPLRAEQSLVAQMANHSALLDQKSQADNAMALLLSDPESPALVVPVSVLQYPLPAIDVGLPADILARRPDMRAAEMRLRASLNSIDATRTSLYPLAITGSIGINSNVLRELLKNPVDSVNAVFDLPNLWTVNAGVGAAQASHEAATALFKQAFYAALRDVDDALTTRGRLEEQAGSQSRSIALTFEIERRARYAHRMGAIPLQTLLETRQALRVDQDNLIAIRNAQWANQATLYLALGGDFKKGPP
jgi:NodT family efflux transporter outer membrane factor (OMF) lipoprotein